MDSVIHQPPRKCRHALAATGSIHRENRLPGFLPAFRNARSGQIALSRFADGSPAPVHCLDGLPRDWCHHHPDGGVSLRPEVSCGFLFANRFYTREEAAREVDAARRQERSCAA